MAHSSSEPRHDTTHLSPEQGKRLIGIGGGLTVLGLALAGFAYFSDHHRFAFSYLTGFVWLTTIGLGGLFFVILQHLTKAGWSVAARRHMEWISTVLPVCALLFIPVVLFSHDIYHHWMGEQAATDELLRKKASWLNANFFYGRGVFYFVVWIFLVWWFGKTSLKQDETGDPKLTSKMQMISAPATLVFALTLTFAAFDWLMSLDPHWYSTIYGVYVFAGSVTSSLSTLALITIALQRSGLLSKVSTIEHQHDIGKLLFGFTVFWAYIAFSQFILIWYANIPEETIFYLHRWEGNWRMISLLLLVGHFILPFLYLLPRTTKRNPIMLGAGAVLMLFMHYVDLYWLVMPTADAHASLAPSTLLVDVGGLVLPIGVLVLVIAVRAAKGPLFPIKDPRLNETYKVENL
jgi:hypothetical protein